jgi:hypothetical protein
MNNRFLKILSCILICISFQFALFGQESGAPPPNPAHKQSIRSKWKERRAERKEWKEERRNKRAEEKRVRDHHKRIQTKEVRKRMKRSKQKATLNHDNKREPFFQRLFHRTGKGKHAKVLKEKKAKA